MTKKVALTAFHQEAIATAANRLFLEKGFHATSMDDIAREAEYSKATLYVYFKNKEQIRHYILLNTIHALHDTILVAVTSSQHAIEQYRAICYACWKYSEEHPAHFGGLRETIAIDAESQSKDVYLQNIYDTGERINDLIEAVINNGVQQGYFKQNLPVVSVGLLYGSMIFSVVELANIKKEYILQRTGMNRDDFFQFAFHTMLCGLLREGVQVDEKKA